jgi:hypothetical protein
MDEGPKSCIAIVLLLLTTDSPGLMGTRITSYCLPTNTFVVSTGNPPMTIITTERQRQSHLKPLASVALGECNGHN